MFRPLFAFLIAVLALVPVVARNAQPSEAVPLFTVEPAAGDPGALAAPAGSRRSRMVRAVPGALAADTLLLPMFPDVVLLAEVTRHEVTAQGWQVWSGRVTGDPLSSATFVSTGRALQGSIRHGGRAYSLEPLAGGAHAIREVDPTSPGEELPPLVGAPQGPALGESRLAAPLDDGTTIDLLVVYTAGARLAAGGLDEAVAARIALGVAETNLAYENSGIVQRLRLVGAELVGYRESGDIGFDLLQLTDTTDGAMDAVHARRTAVGADLVQLIVGPESSNACGVAWLMQSPSTAFAPAGFSVTAYGCISPNYTFGHELGHNMGSAHAPDDPSPTPAFPYSYGYKHAGSLFRTVMAYNCPSGCPRVLHFSNPFGTYEGMPTGTPLHDNARSIDNTRVTVANFRPSRDPATVLGAPAGFDVVTKGTDAVFSWTPPATGVPWSYVLEAGSEAGFADVATFVVGAPATSLSVAKVPPGRYFVRVRAVNGEGPGAPTYPVMIDMTASGRCVAPSGPPTLAAPSVSGRQVTLAWSAPVSGGPAERYVIGAGTAPGRLDVAVIRTGSAAPSMTLDAGAGLYFVRVAGENACGIGEASNEVAVAVGPPIPGPPTGLVSQVGPDGLVSLRWTAPSGGGDPTGYVVEAGSAPGLTDVARLDGNGTETAFVTWAEPRLYFVRVRAANAAGWSVPSNEVIVNVP